MIKITVSPRLDVSVARSLWMEVMVPRRRMVDGGGGPPDALLLLLLLAEKAWRWDGRMRGVERDIVLLDRRPGVGRGNGNGRELDWIGSDIEDRTLSPPFSSEPFFFSSLTSFNLFVTIVLCFGFGCPPFLSFIFVFFSFCSQRRKSRLNVDVGVVGLDAGEEDGVACGLELSATRSRAAGGL
jgi:hypothetical protein